jgi:hypothetical protein
MDLPQIPTDNLYKFMAIVGVVVMTMVIGFSTIKLSDLEFQTIDPGVQTEKIQISTEYLSREIGRTERKTTPTPEELSALDQRRMQLAERRAELDGNLKKARFQLQCMYGLIILSAISTLGGYYMAKRGFAGWYRFVQQPQDALLKAQIKTLENSTTPSPTLDS